MRYQVTFRKRFDEKGEERDSPADLVDVADGIVEDATRVDAVEPPNLHVQGEADEDDGFLTFGSETWIYDIAEGREDEFKHALVNSGVVLEFQELDEELQNLG
jgi:hypothetical protein